MTFFLIFIFALNFFQNIKPALNPELSVVVQARCSIRINNPYSYAAFENEDPENFINIFPVLQNKVRMVTPIDLSALEKARNNGWALPANKQLDEIHALNRKARQINYWRNRQKDSNRTL